MKNGELIFNILLSDREMAGFVSFLWLAGLKTLEKKIPV